MNKNQQGFTLIELIVVMVIIAMIASFMIFNFLEVNKRARDGQRKSDLGSIRSALEIYRSDNPTGSYPASTATAPYIISGTSCGNVFSQTVGGNTINYINKMPCDPNNSTWNGSSNQYFYYNTDSSSGMTYVLVACLENTADQGAIAWSSINFGSASVAEPAGCTTGKYYVVYNP